MADGKSGLTNTQFGKTLDYWWTFSFYLFGIECTFAQIIIPTFSTSALLSSFRHPLYQTWLTAAIGAFVVSFCLLFLWIRPVYKFLRTKDAAMLPEVRGKISHIYIAQAKLVGVMAVCRLLVLILREPAAFSLSALLAVTLPAFAIITFVQYSFSLLYVDQTLAAMAKSLSALYEDDELYRVRPGVSISLFTKMLLLVSSCAIVPFIIIARHTSDNGIFWMMFACAMALVGGMQYFMAGIQRPLNGLLEKMEKVASGDYGVKSRIYYSDEVAHLKAGFNAMLDGLREREVLRETFGRYVSIEIARELLKGRKINLGGEEVEAAVMFCDIRSFTPLSERLSPPELVEFLNAYFAAITPAIAQQRGVINKFIGDAVMAVYTPQLGSSDYAADAVRSAIGMRRALAEFNASFGGDNKVRFGIGIQVGSLVAGNVGTASRLEYTFIGDTVNIASRLEAKTKDFNTDILVTKNVMDMCAGKISGAEFESVGSVPLKGKAEPLELYKVL